MILKTLKNLVGSRKKDKSAPQRTLLNLEYLEDRVVPDAYNWAPSNPAVNDLFSDPSNWWNSTTAATATVAPGPGTDCFFNAASPTTCSVTLSQACRSITTDANWNGSIDLSGAGLHVWGFNGRNSDIDGGSITANTDNGLLDVIGGTFDYNSADINLKILTPKILNVYIQKGGEFVVDRELSSINANFMVGTNPADNSNSLGKLTYNTTLGGVPYTQVNNTTVKVSPTGTLVYNPGAVLKNACFSSSGIVEINDEVNLTVNILQRLMVTGGVLKTAGTGSATITGGVSVGNGTLQMNSSLGNYFYLNIKGDLSFGGWSTFQYHVDAEHSTVCNMIVADKIELTGIVTSSCKNDGIPPPPGDYRYTPLQAVNSLTGTFTFYSWGGVPIVWMRQYTGNSFSLFGTIQVLTLTASPPPP